MSGVAPAGSQSNSIPSMPPLPAMAWRPLPKSSSMPTPPPPDLRAEAMERLAQKSAKKYLPQKRYLPLFLCVGSVCFETVDTKRLLFTFGIRKHYVHCFGNKFHHFEHRGQAHFGLPREASGFRHDAEAQCDRMGRKEVE